MKMGRDLIVPLSRQAMDVVRELQPLTGYGLYLFPGVQRAARPMSENTVNAALRRLGFTGDEMTGHGFRAMARTILDEVLGYRVEWIEHQLAHEVRDHNGRAYNRTAFLQGRKGDDARLGGLSRWFALSEKCRRNSSQGSSITG
jgi:integrase